MQKYRFQANRTKFHSIVSIRKSNSINKKVPTDYFRRKIFFQNPRNESKLFQCSEFKILLISFEKEDPCINIIGFANRSLAGREGSRDILRLAALHLRPYYAVNFAPHDFAHREGEGQREKENKPYLYLDKRYPGRCNYKLREIPRNSL